MFFLSFLIKHCLLEDLKKFLFLTLIFFNHYLGMLIFTSKLIFELLGIQFSFPLLKKLFKKKSLPDFQLVS